MAFVCSFVCLKFNRKRGNELDFYVLLSAHHLLLFRALTDPRDGGDGSRLISGPRLRSLPSVLRDRGRLSPLAARRFKPIFVRAAAGAD